MTNSSSQSSQSSQSRQSSKSPIAPPKEAPTGWLKDFAAEGSGANARTGIVLVHGFTGSPASMRPWAHFLNDRGYTV